MKKLLLLVFILSGSFQTHSALAQGENNIWAFGDSIGLDFTGGSPVLIKSNLWSFESSGSICDAEGKLLFYIGSNYVSKENIIWNSRNQVMPNGNGILGNGYTSTTQGVSIIPFLDGSNRYYIFTLSAQEDLWKEKQTYLRYSILDMSLDNGLGDIISKQKNLILDSFTSEKMTLIKGSNCSIWLIVHRADTSEMHAFKITKSGLISSPVISGFPSERSFPIGTLYPPYMHTAMSSSPKGNLLAVSRDTKPLQLEIYDFDNTTGIIGHKRILDDKSSYWLEFSPDGSKLYTSSPFAQYDISLLPNISLVKASKYIVRDTIENTGMRIGSDNKLYTILNVKSSPYISTQHIYRLNNPNSPGPACGFTHVFTLPTKSRNTNGLGLPIVVPDIIDTITYKKDTLICFSPFAEIIADSGFSSYVWDDGTKGRVKKVFTPGKSWVKMRKGCSLYIDTIYYKGHKSDTFFRRMDTLICFNDTKEITASAGSAHKWNDGDTNRTKAFISTGIYWVSYYNTECSFIIDTFALQMIDFKINLPNSDTICGVTKVTLNASTKNANYLWQDGSTLPTYEVSKAGNYIVLITVGPCTAKHTTVVTKREFSISLGDDKKICEGTPIILSPDIAADAYKWQDGSNSNTYEVKESGIYWLEVSKGNCIASDSVKIEIMRCNHCISIPNAFTPDKNGRNDFFKPLLECPTLSYALKIFNRYGQEIFASTNPSDKWDGTSQNKELELGVYYYFLKVQFDYPGSKEEMYMGDISLIR